MPSEMELMKASPPIGYQSSYMELSKDRIIFISEDITRESAAALSSLLLYYDNVSHEIPIYLYINTNGGDSQALINIYDVMQMIKAPIETVCLGKCYSAGAIILAAGTKGRRYALNSSKIMIHGIQFGFPLPGQDVTTSKNYYQFIKDNNDMVMKILAKHTKKTLAQVKKDCSQDLYMDPKQARDYGIIDYIYS